LESPYFTNALEFITSDSRYNKEMSLARDEFIQFAGAILESDRSYDARVNSLHNWYVLDRPMTSTGVTPLDYFLKYNANTLPAFELERYAELRDNHHSVFEIQKFRKEQTRIRDLITGKKFDIEGVEDTRHLEPGTLFNSRVFTHEGRHYLSNYLLLHPHEVVKSVRVQAKKQRKSKTDPKPFLFQLVLFQSRYDQYTRMEPGNIYRFSA